MVTWAPIARSAARAGMQVGLAQSAGVKCAQDTAPVLSSILLLHAPVTLDGRVLPVMSFDSMSLLQAVGLQPTTAL